MPAVFVFASAVLAAASSNETDCVCPKTSGNRNNCCSEKADGGEGTGDFCGNWFQKTTCGSDAPVCCTSGVIAQCGPEGSSCSPGCAATAVGSTCTVIPPPAPSPASRAYKALLPRAKAIAELAAAAGCGPRETFKAFTCAACREVGFDLVPDSIRFVSGRELYTDNATFAYVARLQGQDSGDAGADCVVSNRGSVNLANWVEDFEFWRQKPAAVERCEGCEMHSGFYQAWKDLELDAIAALADIGCVAGGSNNRVLVTGHSFGAAMSIVAMFSLQGKGFEVQQGLVFEPPRVGNVQFSEAFAARFDRDIPVFIHTHAQDPVVHLPPMNIPDIEYKHVRAPEVYYYPSFADEDHIVCEGPEDAACSNRYDVVGDLVVGGTSDHCEHLALAPNVNKKGVPDFCYLPLGWCASYSTDCEDMSGYYVDDRYSKNIVVTQQDCKTTIDYGGESLDGFAHKASIQVSGFNSDGTLEAGRIRFGDGGLWERQASRCANITGSYTDARWKRSVQVTEEDCRLTVDYGGKALSGSVFGERVTVESFHAGGKLQANGDIAFADGGLWSKQTIVFV